MNKAMARPLAAGSSKISAYTPPVTDMGQLAFTPVMNLNIKRLAKLGATAHAMVKIVKSKNVITNIILRP